MHTPPSDSELPDYDEAFIEYPLGCSVVDHILNLIDRPYRLRPEGLTIIGPPNNGKTFLMLRSMKCLTKKYQNPLSSLVHVPVVYVKAPVKANRRRFFMDLCEAVRAPLPSRVQIDVMAYRGFKAMRDAGVKGIFIDELHHLVAGTHKDCEALLDDIKVLADDLGIPVISAGTNRALQAIKRDEQYLSRFPPIELPLWPLDEQFVALLRGLEMRLGIDSGALANQQIGELIWTHSKGFLGRVVRIVKEAKEFAEQEGSITILPLHIQRAGFKDLPWAQPR